MTVSPASSSAVQALHVLGARLREIRVEADLTGRDLARITGWHSSKISRIEHGRQRPSARDIRTWCAACGTPRLTNDLTAALHSVEGMFIQWRRIERAGLPAAQEAVRDLWERTQWFRIYSGWVIPAPVQTRDYVTAVLNSVRIRRDLPDDPDDVEQAVNSRIDRQRITHQGHRRFAIILEEHVLRNPVGGTDTMTAQLGHLLAASTLPAISLGVIPQGVDRTQTRPVEGFWLFDDTRATVELAMYAKAFGELSALAVYGPPARALLSNALTAIGQ